MAARNTAIRDLAARAESDSSDSDTSHSLEMLLVDSDASSSGVELLAESIVTSDDDEHAIRGTVFHQLLVALLLPEDPTRDSDMAVDISPDLPVILAAMKVNKSIEAAIETAVRVE